MRRQRGESYWDLADREKDARKSGDLEVSEEQRALERACQQRDQQQAQDEVAAVLSLGRHGARTLAEEERGRCERT